RPGPPPPAALRQHASSAVRAPVQLPAFDRAVFLSHVNDPARTPLFPGDPAFPIHTVFTPPSAAAAVPRRPGLLDPPGVHAPGRRLLPRARARGRAHRDALQRTVPLP